MKENRDKTPTLQSALQTFTTRHPSRAHLPTTTDMSFLRALARHITRRSASLVAASLFALWELKAEAEAELLSTLAQSESGNDAESSSSAFAAETATEIALSRGTTTVAFNGSVVEFYPGYREALQGFVDGLLADAGGEADEGENGAGSGSGKMGEIVLVEANESSLRGAAVALACLA